MNELVLHRRAARYYRRLPANVKASLGQKLEKLREDPLNYPGSIKMAGEWSGYNRFRDGNLRVIYCYHAEESRIYVNFIGPRGDIYK